MTFCPAVTVSILEILALLHIMPKFQFSNLLLNWHCVLNAQCVTHFGSAMCSLSLAYSSSNIPPNIHQLQISSNIIWAAQRGWYPQSNCHCPIGELLIRNVVMDHEDKYKYNTNTRVVSPIQRSLLSNCHRQSTSCYGHQTNTEDKYKYKRLCRACTFLILSYASCSTLCTRQLEGRSVRCTTTVVVSN